MNNKPQLVVLPIDKRHSTTSTAKGIRMSVHHLRNSAEFVDEYIVNNGGEKIPGYVDALTQSGIREQKIYATKMVKYINDEIGTEYLYLNILHYARIQGLMDSSFVPETIEKFVNSNNKTLRKIGKQMKTMWEEKQWKEQLPNQEFLHDINTVFGGVKKQKRNTKRKRKRKRKRKTQKCNT